ncbi:MAG: sterol desaturase family protein [Saprospiraceae bacterium]
MAKLYVSNKDESVKMFENDFLERFTKVHFSVPLLLYVPFVIYFLVQAVADRGLMWWQIPAYFLLGILVWSITEYVMHRFVFHYELPGKLGKRLHFIFHGVHHDYPNDSKRLVLPPSVSIPLALLFYYGFDALLGNSLNAPFFAGFLVGYLFYDMLHYAVHHVNSNNKIFIALKTHHLKHHFKEPNLGYGVSSPLWDVMVGTTFENKKNVRKGS